MSTLLMLLLGLLFFLSCTARQEFAGEITTVTEGSELIAKLPCLECPFLVAHATGDGDERGWSKTEHESALLLNISMANANSQLLVNGGTVWPLDSDPSKIYAIQVPQDITNGALGKLISSEALHSHNSTETGCASFGLSYIQSVRSIENSPAIVIHFDIFELWTDLPREPLTHEMTTATQKVLQITLLNRPVFSALEPRAWEIVRVELSPRDMYAKKHRGSAGPGDTIMRFHDWDAYGKKGTLAHNLYKFGDAFVTLLIVDARVIMMIAGGLSFLAFILVIYVLYYLCMHGYQDDYQYQHAQLGKSAIRKRKGDDEERGVGFFNREEVGMLRRAQMAGLEKHD